VYRETLVARDSSGRGNDIPLVTLPVASKQTIEKVCCRAQQAWESCVVLWGAACAN